MTTLQSLLGFAAWTLLLVSAVLLYRGLRIATGTPINHWPRHARPTDDAPFAQRLEAAHSNCLENLPVYAVIVLAAAAMGRLDSLAPLASWVLYARVAQSLVHLAGVSPALVFVRANLWAAQLALMFVMLFKLLG